MASFGRGVYSSLSLVETFSPASISSGEAGDLPFMMASLRPRRGFSSSRYYIKFTLVVTEKGDL